MRKRIKLRQMRVSYLQLLGYESMKLHRFKLIGKFNQFLIMKKINNFYRSSTDKYKRKSLRVKKHWTSLYIQECISIGDKLRVRNDTMIIDNEHLNKRDLMIVLRDYIHDVENYKDKFIKEMKLLKND